MKDNRSLIQTSHIYHRCRAAGRNQQVEEHKHTYTALTVLFGWTCPLLMDLSVQIKLALTSLLRRTLESDECN